MVNCNDNKFWKVIDSVPNGNTKCVVQPLLCTNGSFDFDDKNITFMLEKAHIKRSDTSTSTIFDEQFYNNVNNEITSLIEA